MVEHLLCKQGVIGSNPFASRVCPVVGCRRFPEPSRVMAPAPGRGGCFVACGCATARPFEVVGCGSFTGEDGNGWLGAAPGRGPRGWAFVLSA